MVPPIIQAPGPAVNVPAPILPPPAAASPVTAVAAPFPPAVISSLQNALDRYLESPLPKIRYPYEILLIEIDPDTIGGRVMSAAGVPGGYPWRVVPAVPPGAAYPAGYQEAETVLVQGTNLALMTAIVANFSSNRHRDIREMYGQMGDFDYRAVLECPNIRIKDSLSLMRWISRLRFWNSEYEPPRVHIIRQRAPGGGRADTPPTVGEAVTYINTGRIQPPQAIT